MNNMFLFNLGRFMGWLVAIGFIGAALNPVFKWINKHIMMKRQRDDGLRKGYQAFLRHYLKAHPFVGLTTAVFLIVHLAIQFSFYGFYLTGMIAGLLLLAQTGLGAYGQWRQKRRPGTWLTIHRWITVVMVVAVVVHIAGARS